MTHTTASKGWLRLGSGVTFSNVCVLAATTFAQKCTGGRFVCLARQRRNSVQGSGPTEPTLELRLQIAQFLKEIRLRMPRLRDYALSGDDLMRFGN